jgi:molybdopterin/thiamine biosynthesis adenylyltransferase
VRPPWFEREPELLEWELEQFRLRGLTPEVDEGARASGRLVVRCLVPFKGEEIPVEARYPDETPELPPQIFGPVGLLDRHEHAFSGNFCLLARPLDDWPAATWGAADLIAERLTALFADTEAGPEAVRAAEAPMPEPYTSYYSYSFPGIVLMPEALSHPDRDHGTLSVRPFANEPARFIVESVSGAISDGALTKTIGVGDRINVPWKRISAPPPGPDAADVYRWAISNHRDMIKPPVPPKLAGSRFLAPPALQLAAFVFAEEGPGVGETRDAWLFLGVVNNQPFLPHCQVTSPTERQRRTPGLEPLADKRVVVVGLGTLGGDVALELAKAGAGVLDLVDFDRYEINNSVRHVLEPWWSGIAKVEAMARKCLQMNPYCEPRPRQMLLGATDWDGPSPLAQLAELVEGADLVVETTGSYQLQNLVGRIAREAGVPMASCWLTAGFYGAHVIRVIPGETACAVCVATRFSAEELLKAEAGPDDQVVAQGCSHPTVPGAGFDAAETAAVATRLAVQTLVRDRGGYTDADWDHAAISFRRSGTDPEFPRFATEQLEPTEGCLQCSSAVGSSAPL